ncbi:hypothetical protein Q9K02_04210 [Qipengyuania sp. G39]|uniref:Uncharacterized protein n=1 Tax=Qipengyuania profundimaris TaxID=3067652 RepID=A0ABT9HMW9_9SPHN|nr:hypothetical protein [Qipengyuania sp. G39]MDP4574340.1 hypothetical protein [Qipengyuania sp. G39]
MTRGFPLVLACALGLAACGDDAADASAEGDERGARGEVLGGTISDDMIPLDQLQSQSAPQNPDLDSGDGSGSDTSQEPAADAPTESAAEAEAPAAPQESEEDLGEE